jgi:ribonuclease Z
MRVTFLGTIAARPTPARNVSSLVIRREGELLMFDCGEGTQRQMMRCGTGFDLSDIFFSHLHADHFLGVIGLLQTLGLQGRREGIRLWTPLGTEEMLRQAIALGGRLPFGVEIVGVEAGERVERRGYEIRPFRSSHRGRSLGYALVEEERLGRFDPVRARELGVPEGPLWGRLHRGEAGVRRLILTGAPSRSHGRYRVRHSVRCEPAPPSAGTCSRPSWNSRSPGRSRRQLPDRAPTRGMTCEPR